VLDQAIAKYQIFDLSLVDPGNTEGSG